MRRGCRGTTRMATFTRGARPGAEYYYDPMRGFAFLSPKRSAFEHAQVFRQSLFEIAEEQRYSTFEFAKEQREDRYEARVFGARYQSGELFEIPSFIKWASEGFCS